MSDEWFCPTCGMSEHAVAVWESAQRDGWNKDYGTRTNAGIAFDYLVDEHDLNEHDFDDGEDDENTFDTIRDRIR